MQGQPDTISQNERRQLVFILSLYGMGAGDVKKLWNHFSKIEDVQHGTLKEYIVAGLSPVKAKRLADWFLLETPESQDMSRKKYDVKCLTYFDNEFPLLLSQIPSCPYMIYYKGSLDSLQSNNHLAVVGTRKPSSYGRNVCQMLCSQLVSQNISIVSGLATGIDAVAHKCAVEANKPTIAVLAHGLDHVQPRSNAQLAKEILDTGGALVSEYPIHVSALRQHFPARNRLVAGLSQGTLVVEGTERSGSLITAKFTKKYQRKLFAVPGAISNPMSSGPNSLIKEGGVIVLSTQSIISEISLEKKTIQAKLFDSKYQAENKLQESILSMLSDAPKSVDQLVRTLQKSPAEILSEIGMIELDGGIIKQSDGTFKIN